MSETGSVIPNERKTLSVIMQRVSMDRCDEDELVVTEMLVSCVQ